METDNFNLRPCLHDAGWILKYHKNASFWPSNYTSRVWDELFLGCLFWQKINSRVSFWERSQIDIHFRVGCQLRRISLYGINFDLILYDWIEFSIFVAILVFTCSKSWGLVFGKYINCRV